MMPLDIICSIITARWQEVWLPGSIFVIYESVYDYVGESPVHVYAISLSSFSPFSPLL